MEKYRITSLENFDVTDSGVCNVSVYPRRPVPTWTGTGTTSYRLLET